MFRTIALAASEGNCTQGQLEQPPDLVVHKPTILSYQL